MTYPIKVIVTIDFSTGATFGYPFILDDPDHGKLGTGTLADSANTTIDVSNQTISAALRGSYNLLQDQFEPGTATFRIVDPNGDFNPQNTASPYYGQLLPLRKIRCSAFYNGVNYYLFSGYIQSWLYSYPKNQDIGYVDIIAADGFRLMNMTNITTVTGAVAGETTGARVNKILDQISWPANMRSIDTGDSTVQADPAQLRSSLNAIKNVEFSEQGAFYINGEGNAYFIGRHNLQKKAGVTPTVFANNGTGIPYWQLQLANDDKLVINSASITRIGGTAQVASDAASIATYFPHSFSVNNLVVETDAEALNIARAYVATRKDTTIRIDAMILDLTTPNYDAGITAALSADNFSLFKIINESQGNVTLTKTLEVVSVAHDITPNTWKTTFTTSEPIIDAFILDSATFGVLDVSTLSY